ncbi:hypothetical protein B0A48_17782 [Cryoendolithus antarcticus]|uniref:Uncharacterized protein n=1 Tax=Cryoendolithus antarcticus TaxID=1507870 RepID=A0A1V8S9M4_9PEZI|nr:hypothetical protein B0A48_17782 [Cryoendolithus antarcticus]
MRLLRDLIDITIASLSFLRSCSITIAALVGCAITSTRDWRAVLGREVKQYSFYQVSPQVIGEVLRETSAWRRRQQNRADTASNTHSLVLTEKIIVGEVKFSERDKERLSRQIEAQGKPKSRQASAVYQRRPERKKRSDPQSEAPEEAVDSGESHSAEQIKQPEPPTQQRRGNTLEHQLPEEAVEDVDTHSAEKTKEAEVPIQRERKSSLDLLLPEEVVDSVESNSVEQTEFPEPPNHRHRSISLHLPSLLPQQQPPTPRIILPGLSSQSSPERRARKQSLKQALTTAIKRAAMRQSQDSLLSGTTAQASAESPQSPMKFDWTPVRRRALSVQERGGLDSSNAAFSEGERGESKPFTFNVQAAEFKPAVQQETPRLPEWRRKARPLPSFAGTPPALYQSPTMQSPLMQYHTPPSPPRTLQSPQQESMHTQTFVPDLEPKATRTLDQLREHHTALLASLHHYAPAYLALGRLYHSTPMTARTSPWILPAFQQVVGEAFMVSRDRQLPELVQIFGEISMRLTQTSKMLVQMADEDLGKLEAELKRCDELLGEAAVRLKMLQSAVGDICGVFENDRERCRAESEEGWRARGVAERAWVVVLPEVCSVQEQ